MKRFPLILLVVVATFALGVIITGALFMRTNSSKKSASQPPKPYPHIHVPRSEYEANAKLSTNSYTLSEGDTLERIAALRYGHRYYGRLIELSNRIEDVNNLKVGRQLKLPNLIDLLTEEGFTKAAPTEAELILCSRAKYEKVKDQLRSLRREAKQAESIVVPEEIKITLLEAASDLEEAVNGLSADRPGVTQTPRSMIGQLGQVAGGLRELAEGANDGYGYDLDLVEQRYAIALSYGIIWAREGFG